MSLFKTLAHLPVNKISDMVAEHFCDPNNVTLVTSSTGSGKTLLIPPTCYEELPDGEILYVILPSAIMANRAYGTIKILHKDTDLVGFAGRTEGWTDELSPNNRIIFMSLVRAIEDKILIRGRNFILDESHERTVFMTFAKTILQRRREKGERIRVALMSSTMDIAEEKAFWGEERTKAFYVEGDVHPLKFIEGDIPPEEAVSYLIDEGRTGILVFVSGENEAIAVTSAIRKILAKKHSELYRLRNFEICQYTLLSSTKDQRIALSNPKTGLKIVVGTRVIETSLSMKWVNGGVSTGNGQITTWKHGVVSNHAEELSQWRIIQQAGRTNRFTEGTFVLASRVPFAERPLQEPAKIVVSATTDFVFKAAQYGINPLELKFPKSEDPGREALQEGNQALHNTGITTGEQGKVNLTPEGQWIARYGFPAEAGAFLAQARDLNILPYAVPLAARVMIGGLRFALAKPIAETFCGKSDLMNEVFAAVYCIQRESSRGDLSSQYNLNKKKLGAFTRAADRIASVLNIRPIFTMWDDRHRDYELLNDEMMFKLIACLVRSSPQRLFRATPIGVSMKNGVSMAFATSTHAVHGQETPDEMVAVHAVPRRIIPMDHTRSPFNVASDVTIINKAEKDRLFEIMPRAWFTSYLGK